MDSTGSGLSKQAQGWSHIDRDRAARFYTNNARGISVHVEDLRILDWFSRTQNRAEWNYYEYTHIVSMTHRVYTMFLLRWSNTI